MNSRPSIACFGAAHWDFIGQADPGFSGPDRPGTVTVRPGGVAVNVAIELAAQGCRTELLSAVGRDRDGKALLAELKAAGIGTSLTQVSEALPTGRYLALEDETGELTSAIADCRAVDALSVGAFNNIAAATADYWFVEANLPTAVIQDLAFVRPRPPLIANPVSPARADRLQPFLDKIDILYCNRAEASALCANIFPTAADAARDLTTRGVRRAVVTDGPEPVCDASPEGIFIAPADPVGFISATGAGDVFLSRHLAAVIAGKDPSSALRAALAHKGKERA
ncbi:PfkB family carbohydrate kinase [Hwanghaeella grinnelliae]|nr:PfkB family carbohydrate kinase [Hwanghaeella grinnelliae]